MKKIIAIGLLLSTAVVAQAEKQYTQEEITAYREQWAREHFAKQGLPGPDSGVTIIPYAQMKDSKSARAQRLKSKTEYLTKGYVSQYSERAKELLDMEIVAKHLFAKKNLNYKPTSTELKPSINDLKMAYTFIGAPNDLGITILGAAPYLSYLKGQGWVGAVQFFKKEKVGICAFSENNVKLSHGAVILAKEDVTQDVNGKPTIKEITGNADSGFLYNVEWYDNTFFRQLECANMRYSTEITTSVIALANQLDT